MKTQTMRVLIVEDDETFAKFLATALRTSSQGTFDPDLAYDLETAEQVLAERRFDGVLLDLELPGTAGLDTLRRVLARAPELPIVILTGSAKAEEMAVQAVASGAQDYLFKGTVGEDVLSRSLKYAIERKRQELQLRRQADELARSNRDLEQFAFVASHDLQAPLKTLTSFLDLLERRYRGQLDAEAMEFIAFSVQAADRMKAMVRALLQFSRVSTHGEPLSRVSASHAVAAALKNLAHEIAACGADVQAEPLPELDADSEQLVQLFQNLIDNAIKYRGDDPPRVRIDARADGPDWHFRVSDNGIGIDPRFHNKVFLLFRRLHTAERYPGTGVGLAICRRIVERHRGRIWIESGKGQGSTFHVALPRQQPYSSTVSVPERRDDGSSLTPPASP